MKKIGAYISPLLLLLAISVIAQDLNFKPRKAIVTGTAPTVRHIPSAGGNIIATLRTGDIVNIIEKSKNPSEIDDVIEYWYKVELYNNKKGWVYGQFISFDLNYETEAKWKRAMANENQKFTSIEITESGRMIVGTESGHLYFSSDDGKNFTKLLPHTLGTSIGRINSTLTGRDSIWVAASGDSNGGVWRSDNDGITWLQISKSQGLISNDVNNIVEKNGALYIATNEGLCCTKDNGKTFIIEQNVKMQVNQLVVTDDTIFAGTSKGLYVGKNNKWILGRNAKVWGIYKSKTHNMGNSVNTVAISPTDEIYIGTNLGMAKASLYRLNRWASIGSKVEINSIFIGQDARILAATNYGLSISTDNGVSWITHRTEDNAARNNIFRVSVNNATGTIWAILTDYRLYYSTSE